MMETVTSYLFKRFVSAVLFLLFVVPVTWAQEQQIYIDSFTHEPMDQTAKEQEKKDANGNLYALVKVRPSAKDFKFEFGYIKCEPGGEHDGETWLYVGKGARKVTIRREGYEPLRAVDLGMTLEAGETYVMQLSYTAPKVKKQMLQFTVQPAGASAVVMIKSAEAESFELFGATSTKSEVSKNMPLGTYTYQVLAENFIKAEGLVVLDNEQETKMEKVTLTPNVGATTLSVNADADIYVDGSLKGTRLWSGELEAGEYNVEVRQANHRSTFQRITVKRNESQSITLAPPTPIYGSVSVISEPSGAKIGIDGKQYGITPRNVPDVLIGNHKLTLTLPNYLEEELSFNVKEGEVTNVKAKMTKLSAVGRKSRYANMKLKPYQIYVSPTFQVGTFMGVGGSVGAYIDNFNVELSFIYGIGKSDTLYLVSKYGIEMLHQSFFHFFAGGKVGYGISLKSNLRITPQMGAGIVAFNNSPFPKSSAIVATVGARLDYAFTSHFGVFIAPEGGFAVKKSEGFKYIAEVSPKIKGWATGFNCKLGVSVFF